LDKYFKKADVRVKILTKDTKAIESFVNDINKTFETDYTCDEWVGTGNEVEFPIVKEDEIFNFKLI